MNNWHPSSTRPSYQSISSSSISNSSDAPWKSKQYGSSIAVYIDEDVESFLHKKHPSLEKDCDGDKDDDDDEECTWFGRLIRTGFRHVNQWLEQDAKVHDYEELRTGLWERQRQRTAALFVRRHLYDPTAAVAAKRLPNKYNAALIAGIAVGIWIIPFKFAIEIGLDLIWKHVPAFLQQHGVFESLGLPSYLYTAVIITLGCTLTGWQFERIKCMPSQNSLIDDMTATGRVSAQQLWPLVGLALTAMWSGLPLGPELPLLLTFSMFGSWMGQHVLQLDGDQNLALMYYSMSAAIGAFFSYPIGAFLFVLEVPHRMGVLHRMGRLHTQLLGPCAVASPTGTVTHSYLTGKPVERLFSFPGDFPEGLTCPIFLVVLAAAAVGCGTGTLYTVTVKGIKTAVHAISNAVIPVPPAAEFDDGLDESNICVQKKIEITCKDTDRVERNKLLLHAAVCMMDGLVYSIICMTFPHVFSWGEAQLQNVLDSGATTLPYFGGADSPLIAPFAQCMPNPDGHVPAWCMAAIPLAKTLAIGLVLGTSVQCGHFWGPIYVGAAVGQFALHLASLFGLISPKSSGLFILCVMASAHVVSFRSPLGISLLLMQSAGYDIIVSTAVLVAAHTSLYISRDVVFYKSQNDHTPVADEEER